MMGEAAMGSQSGSTSWSGTGLVGILFISLRLRPRLIAAGAKTRRALPDLMVGRGPASPCPQAQRAGAASQKAVLSAGFGWRSFRPILARCTSRDPPPRSSAKIGWGNRAGPSKTGLPPSLSLAHVARLGLRNSDLEVTLGPSGAEHQQPATNPNRTTSMHGQLSMELCRRRL